MNGPCRPCQESAALYETKKEMDFFPRKCNVCLNDAVSVCGECREVAYCGKECQKVDWFQAGHNCLIEGKGAQKRAQKNADYHQGEKRDTSGLRKIYHRKKQKDYQKQANSAKTARKSKKAHKRMVKRANKKKK